MPPARRPRRRLSRQVSFAPRASRARRARLALLALLGPGALAAACGSRAAAPPPDPVALGEATFRDTCARCHGAEGTGGVALTDGGPRPRDLTDPAWQAARTDVQLRAFVREGRPPMPAFGDVLTAAQLDAVVAKVRRLGRAATTRPTPPAPAAPDETPSPAPAKDNR